MHADAVMDRIVHNTIWVDTGTHTMSRQETARRVSAAPHHDGHWPPQAIFLAPNRKIGWPSHLRILRRAPEAFDGSSLCRYGAVGLTSLVDMAGPLGVPY